MDPCLRKMLRETVAIAQVTGRDSYGDPVIGEPKYVAAYVEIDRGERPGPSGGIQSETRHRIWVEDEITMDDRIWLPGEDVEEINPRTPYTVAVYRVPMSSEISHYEVVV